MARLKWDRTPTKDYNTIEYYARNGYNELDYETRCLRLYDFYKKKRDRKRHKKVKKTKKIRRLSKTS
jgi:hypothetical protein